MKWTFLAEAKNETIRWLVSLLSSVPTPKPAAPAGMIAVPPPGFVLANGQTILVVDDDPVFLKATATKLENNGFQVITAKDGSEAIEVARRKKPNLLLLDVNLSADSGGGSVPWDGFRIMSWLRRFDDFKKTPVVMASIGDPVENTRLAIHAGATAFFHKQMNPSQLLSIVNASLARPGIVREPGLDKSFQI